MKQPRFQLYRDAKKEWRWSLLSGNGEIVCDSAEGYKNRIDAIKGIVFVRRVSRVAEIRTKR